MFQTGQTVIALCPQLWEYLIRQMSSWILWLTRHRWKRVKKNQHIFSHILEVFSTSKQVSIIFIYLREGKENKTSLQVKRDLQLLLPFRLLADYLLLFEFTVCLALRMSQNPLNTVVEWNNHSAHPVLSCWRSQSVHQWKRHVLWRMSPHPSQVCLVLQGGRWACLVCLSCFL